MENTKVEIPKSLLDEANADSILSGYITNDPMRVPIYLDKKIVGFFNPVTTRLNGIDYWRTGNIFVSKPYRNKGLGTKTISDFFSDKEYGLATVAANNPISLGIFLKLGFKVDKTFYGMNPKGKALFRLLKNELSYKPPFINW